MAKQKPIIYNAVTGTALHIGWKRKIGFKEMIDLTNFMLDKNKQLLKEIGELKKKEKHWVFVDVDKQRGCNNCKHELGSICKILLKGTHSYLEGVSECGLEHWGNMIE